MLRWRLIANFRSLLFNEFYISLWIVPWLGTMRILDFTLSKMMHNLRWKRKKKVSAQGNFTFQTYECSVIYRAGGIGGVHRMKNFRIGRRGNWECWRSWSQTVASYAEWSTIILWAMSWLRMIFFSGASGRFISLNTSDIWCRYHRVNRIKFPASFRLLPRHTEYSNDWAHEIILKLSVHARKKISDFKFKID